MTRTPFAWAPQMKTPQGDDHHALECDFYRDGSGPPALARGLYWKGSSLLMTESEGFRVKPMRPATGPDAPYFDCREAVTC